MTVMSADIAEGDTEVPTLNQDVMLTVTNAGGAVTVLASNTANVVTEDVEARNGVIYVIDAVLMPNPNRYAFRIYHCASGESNY